MEKVSEYTSVAVGQLPAKTWNRLHMNGSELKWGNETLPCEMTLKEGGKPFDAEIVSGAGLIFAADGLPSVYGAAEKDEKKTVSLHIGGGEAPFTAGKAFFRAEEGSKLTIVLGCEKGENTLAFHLELEAEKNAKIRLIQIQMPGAPATVLSDIHGVCGENGRIEMAQLLIGKGNLYSDCHIDLTGDGSSYSAEIGYLTRGEQKLDCNYVVNHAGKKTESFIRADGTLMDRSSKIFRGTIDFKNGSSGSIGTEQENVLLLGEEIVNQTIPLILCAEEDVQGNHGATIGELDEDILFYFASRGIEREQAEKLMSRAKLDRLCGTFDNEEAVAIAERGIGEVLGNADND